MTTAADSLPDPLAESPPTSGPSPDDMLARMATEEIDRLLAEADTAANAPPVTPAPVPTRRVSREAPPDADDPELTKQLDDLFNALTADDPVAPPAEPPPESLPAAPPEPEPEPVLAEPEPPAIDEPVEAVVPEPEEPVAAPDEHADMTSHLEQQVLAAASFANIPEPAPPAPEATDESPEPDTADEVADMAPRLAAPLRPIAWISARFSEPALDWMGKVAILTTLNALAILAYVLIFRR